MSAPGFAPHFQPHELTCKCGCITPPKILDRLRTLSWHLETIRARVGHPLVVTSGYRCPAHNARTEGAAPQSRHLQGDAADLLVFGMSGPALAAVIVGLILEGAIPEGGVGSYHNRAHYDTRGTRARWAS